MQKEKQEAKVRDWIHLTIKKELAETIDEVVRTSKNEFGEQIFRSRDEFVRRAINRFLIEVKLGGKAE